MLLRQHTVTNPGRLRAVVLLMHPEALRRAGAESYQMAVLLHYLNERDLFRTGDLAGQISFAFGVDIFKGRVLARLLPVPLSGSYGRYYGFNKNLEDFMTANFGSAVDPAVVPLTGSAEYWLSPGLEEAAHQFKSAVPAGVSLFVALSPVPEKYAGPNFQKRQPELLRQWSEWLRADGVLTDLTATLPDDQFACTTHLKPKAVPSYTRALAASIRSRLH
jgi:hypothetical protein